MKPVILATDKAGILAKRLLQKLIRDEQREELTAASDAMPVEAIKV